MLRNFRKTTKIAVICAVIYLLAFGIVQALFPTRPFWNDEWRLIYNIKFKTVPELWGRLDLLQECPRVYLTILKYIGAAFDYSYTSLRLPPLIIALANIFFVFQLHKKLYPDTTTLSYLFILILVSSQTFTDYMTQVKHYEMDIFLSLLTLWQLFALLKITHDGIRRKGQYALLCATMLLLTYLSYIYPITIAPVFPVLALAAWVQQRKSGKSAHAGWVALPLLLAAISIFIFYLVDVKNVVGNQDMYDSYQRAFYHSHKETLAEDFWKLFALVGSGFVFELVFGVLGIAAFIYGIYRLAKTRFTDYTAMQYFHLYAILLLWCVIILFATGRLVGGVARLTAYTVPSIAILIIALLSDLKGRFSHARLSHGIAMVLFLGLFGNIITTCINSFTYPGYKQQIATYRNTAKALRQAREENIPFMVTDGVTGRHPDAVPDGPGHIATNTLSKPVLGEGDFTAEVIIRDHPEYKIWDTIAYFYMPDNKWIERYVQQLPPQYNAAIAGDGIHYKKYYKKEVTK